MSQDYAKTGKIVTPATSTDHAIVRFDGAGGYAIQDSGITIADSNIMTTPAQINSTLATGTAPLAVLSTTKVTSLNADKVDGADLDTSTALGTSDVKVPSQNAVKTYADTKVPKVTLTDHAIPRASGTDGTLQNSLVTIDDNNNMAGILTQLISDGTVTLESIAGLQGGINRGYIRTTTNHPLYFGTNGSSRFYLSELGHIIPHDDDTYNLGSSDLQWNNLWIDGTANIDSLVADTADINGGTVDGATVGANSASSGKFTSVESTGDIYTTAWTSYTPTLVGWTGTPTKTGYYKCIGKRCFVEVFVDGDNTTGTTVSFTAPINAAANPAKQTGFLIILWDLGAYSVAGTVEIAANSNVVTCYRAVYAAWSGTAARIIRCNFNYETA